MIFNVDYSQDHDIGGIINMFGFGNVLATYNRDSYMFSSYMATVENECAEQFAYLDRFKTSYFVDHYKDAFGIDIFYVEGVEDSWDSDIQDYFCATAEFIRAQMSKTKPAKVLINCFAGHNRSATIAVAFLLSYTRRPLCKLLAAVLPERSNMLSRPTWPGRIQSKHMSKSCYFWIASLHKGLLSGTFRGPLLSYAQVS